MIARASLSAIALPRRFLGALPRRGSTTGGVNRVLLFLVLAGAVGCKTAGSDGVTPPKVDLPPVAPNALRAPADFAVFTDRRDRSRALFLEASRVLLHPRCANCHPDGDSPLQGMDSHVHSPPVVRGPEDKGVVGMQCQGCHQERNVELARVPGAPNWHVAPRVMAWVGKSPHQICEQIKDRKRNGGRDLAAIVEHNAHDELVGWGWRPGDGREAAPGTQEQFGAIFAAWVETGAECPEEGQR